MSYTLKFIIQISLILALKNVLPSLGWFVVDEVSIALIWVFGVGISMVRGENTYLSILEFDLCKYYIGSIYNQCKNYLHQF